MSPSASQSKKVGRVKERLFIRENGFLSCKVWAALCMFVYEHCTQTQRPTQQTTSNIHYKHTHTHTNTHTPQVCHGMLRTNITSLHQILPGRSDADAQMIRPLTLLFPLGAAFWMQKTFRALAIIPNFTKCPFRGSETATSPNTAPPAKGAYQSSATIRKVRKL